MAEISNLELYYRKKQKRRKIIIKRIVLLLLIVLAVFGVIAFNKILNNKNGFSSKEIEKIKNIEIPDWIDEQIIRLHNTARTGAELDGVNNIVIHYVGNPATSAQNNRDYFNKSSTGVSSHFVVGLDGEIIQCVPLWEKSAASNHRNNDTISIEVCHPDKSGRFNEATYNSVIKLTAWLLFKFGLDETAIIRHYDITEKLCPLYYVEHEDEWNNLKKDAGKSLDEYKKK